MCYILSLGVAMACSDDSYRGSADAEWVEEELVPVMVVVGDPDHLIVSPETPETPEGKGSGAVDNDSEDAWQDASIYVYAFKRDLQSDFRMTSMEGNGWCLVDGATDEVGSLAGKRARIGRLDAYVTWEGAVRSIYYPQGNTPYDFYAYYIDDIEVTQEQITRTEEAVQLEVEIDGSQDLMTSKAELTDEQLYREDFTDEQRLDVMNYSYSSYTAKLNIQPVLYFKHHLSRLRFEIYPGREVANGVYVDSITVCSRTKAVFTVAAKAENSMGADFSADSTYKRLALREEDGSRLRRDFYHTNYTGDFNLPLYERDGVQVGGSLLVAPDTQYEAHIYLKEQRKEGGVTYTYENIVPLTCNEGRFEPGKQYTVRIGIYGMMEVDVGVEVVPWGYGGSLVIDGEEIVNKINK